MIYAFYGIRTITLNNNFTSFVQQFKTKNLSYQYIIIKVPTFHNQHINEFVILVEKPEILNFII